jgi:hypothetical protein
MTRSILIGGMSGNDELIGVLIDIMQSFGGNKCLRLQVIRIVANISVRIHGYPIPICAICAMRYAGLS